MPKPKKIDRDYYFNKYQWKRWFAWRPVTTVGGERIWWDWCYRKVVHSAWYGGIDVDRYYATDFDLLKETPR